MRSPNWKKVGFALVSVFLFILAIQLMKDGASTIAPFIQGWFDVDNASNSLGFGWLAASVILSGSPVAAAALTFFDAGAIEQFEAFAMISGSRLGASFVVLFIGFIYILRGRERTTGLAMGLLTFIITAFLHLPALAVGYLMFTHRLADPIQFHGGASLTSAIDVIYGPIVSAVLKYSPGWLVFIGGIGIVLLSLSIFDRALPDLRLESTEFRAVPRVIYRPIVMFLMGLAVTLLSMSVSISLGILVPLSARGYIRSENAIAYVMGANVSTFVDTLLVALLLNSPPASAIVLVQMISIAIVSLTVLAVMYGPYERVILHLTTRIVESNRNLAIFMVSILIAPILLMLA